MLKLLWLSEMGSSVASDYCVAEADQWTNYFISFKVEMLILRSCGWFELNHTYHIHAHVSN